MADRDYTKEAVNLIYGVSEIAKQANKLSPKKQDDGFYGHLKGGQKGKPIYGGIEGGC